MTKNIGTKIIEHFSDVEDPRMDRTKLQPLENIIVIALCAVICGAGSWVDIELFGESKRELHTDVKDLFEGAQIITSWIVTTTGPLAKGMVASRSASAGRRLILTTSRPYTNRINGLDSRQL